MVTTRRQQQQQQRTPSPPPEPVGKQGYGGYPTPARVRVFQLRQELGYSAKQTQEETGVPI